MFPAHTVLKSMCARMDGQRELNLNDILLPLYAMEAWWETEFDKMVQEFGVDGVSWIMPFA